MGNNFGFEFILVQSLLNTGEKIVKRSQAICLRNVKYGISRSEQLTLVKQYTNSYLLTFHAKRVQKPRCFRCRIMLGKQSDRCFYKIKDGLKSIRKFLQKEQIIQH